MARAKCSIQKGHEIDHVISESGQCMSGAEDMSVLTII